MDCLLSPSLGCRAAATVTRRSLATLAGRAQAIVENSARHLIVPAANLVISYLVIRNASEGLWGNFVIHLVVVTLSTHLLSWGNKEYLLRAFSAEPEDVSVLWQRSLATRAPALLLPLALLLVLGYRGELLCWLGLWIVLALAYQSLDVVVLYQRRFRLAIAAELAALAVTTSILVVLADHLSERTLVMAFVTGLAVKTGITVLGMSRRLFSRWSPVFDSRHLVVAAPFFLIGLSGMLQSRVDLYAVALFLSRADIGRYQVTISLFIAFQGVAAFVLMPFVKNLYRSDDEISHAVSRKLMAAGVVMAVVAVPLAMLVLDRLYGFDLQWPIFVAGALTVPPIFAYLPLIYLLYKHGREKHVMVVNFAGAAVNLALTLCLLPSLGMLGALVAAAGAQWLMMFWYFASARRMAGE